MTLFLCFFNAVCAWAMYAAGNHVTAMVNAACFGLLLGCWLEEHTSW